MGKTKAGSGEKEVQKLKRFQQRASLTKKGAGTVVERMLKKSMFSTRINRRTKR